MPTCTPWLRDRRGSGGGQLHERGHRRIPARPRARFYFLEMNTRLPQVSTRQTEMTRDRPRAALQIEISGQALSSNGSWNPRGRTIEGA